MTFNIIHIIAVMGGGAIGSALRYALSSAVGLHGILLVNIIGCFIVGALMSFIALKTSLHQGVSLFLFVGLLGGFTTFSAFSVEAVNMIDTHRYLQAVTYIAASVGGGLIAFILGRSLVRTFL